METGNAECEEQRHLRGPGCTHQTDEEQVLFEVDQRGGQRLSLEEADAQEGEQRERRTGQHLDEQLPRQQQPLGARVAAVQELVPVVAGQAEDQAGLRHRHWTASRCRRSRGGEETLD